jgi:hypothetical protein
MTYDEAIQQAETILKELEQAEALSMEVYQQKAKQVKELLQFCKQQIVKMEQEFIENDANAWPIPLRK